MGNHDKRVINQAKACTGNSCGTPYRHQMNRRALLQGAALGTAGLAFASLPEGMFAAQDGSMIDSLNLGSFGGGSNPQINFNPYSPNLLAGGANMFEKLYEVNDYSCEEVPWLAESYEWRDDQTLAFTIREGVTWHDGEAFDAADVVFTFNMINEFPALDLNGAWTYLETVTAEENVVVFAFNEVAIPEFFRVVEVLMVPEHVWSAVEDPLTFLNETPVGTGPFTYENFNGEQLTALRYPEYWQADKIRVEQLVWRKAGEGQVDQLRLADGEYDWNSMYVPNVEQVFVAQDPDYNKYWFSQGSSISLAFNLTKEPFNDPEFRRGVAWALDRDKIIQNAQLGYVTQASQTGLKLPGQSDWLNTEIENEGYLGRDLDKARQILTDAGYAMDGDTLLDKSGNPIEFSFMVPAGYADWIQAAQIVQESVQELGMTMNVETPEVSLHDQDRNNGNYDSYFQVHGGLCNMWSNFFTNFHSVVSAPVGEDAVSNWVRYMNPEFDELCDQLRVTSDQGEQEQIVDQLQTIFYNDLPVIDIWYGAIWFEYRTEKAEGWPSEENPYCSPNDTLLVLTNLVPAGEGA
ncbi:MAG: ABC transporter substrate-binding protein [Thermomicrobiales bacterium]